MELSEKVRIRREELGMSQDELAKRMGYSSRSSINKIENGRRVSQKIIVRLASALGVSVRYLMDWEEEAKAESTDYSIALGKDEIRLLEISKGLSDDGLNRLIEYAELLAEKYKK